MLRIASIACEPSRYEQLKRAVESLYHQVDQIWLYLNEFKDYPEWIHSYNEGKIICYSSEHEYWNLTDNGKFYALSKINEPCYFFPCDSDLIYPSDYIQHTVELIYRYGVIITYHGRILKEPIRNYYKGHTVFDFRGVQDRDSFVDVAGTGVCGFLTDYFNPKDIYKSEYKCMSDLVFSLEAKRQGKRMICAAHAQNWIVQQPVETGIMHTHAGKNEENQIELAKLIYEI